MAIKSIHFDRRTVQTTLGLLWILDGLLQLQPKMFTSDFVRQVIEPAATGQPSFITAASHLFVRIFLLHPAVFNSFVAIAQIAIGVLILRPRTVKLGLFVSIGWGLFVWYIGEALGDIFGGQTLLLMGAPGAALLYAIIALAVIPKNDDDKIKSPRRQLADIWLVAVWVVIWIGGALYQLLPGQNSVGAVSGMIAGNATRAPHWLSYLDIHAANHINALGTLRISPAAMHMTSAQMMGMSAPASVVPGSGYWFILLLAGLQLFVGLGVLGRPFLKKIAFGVGICLLACFWVLGQKLGGYYSGVMTDPNSAPMIALLGLVVMSFPELDHQLTKLFHRLETVLT